MTEEISVKEAMELLHTTKATIYNHIRKGSLHPIRKALGVGIGGRRTWLDRAEVEALKTAPAPPATATAPEAGTAAPRSARPKAKAKRNKRK